MNTKIQSGTNLDLKGTLILLNGDNNSKGAARINDTTIGQINPIIYTGSHSVLIGD